MYYDNLQSAMNQAFALGAISDRLMWATKEFPCVCGSPLHAGACLPTGETVDQGHIPKYRLQPSHLRRTYKTYY